MRTNHRRNFMNWFWRCLLVVTCCPLAISQSSVRSIKIGKFPQEDPVHFVSGAGQSLVDAKRLYIDSNDRLHVQAGGTHLTLPLNPRAVPLNPQAVPLNPQAADWKVEGTSDLPKANQVLVVGKRTLLASDDGVLVDEDGKQSSLGLVGRKVVGISIAKDGRIAAAEDDGVFEFANGKWNQFVIDDSLGRQWAAKDMGRYHDFIQEQ